MKLKDKPSKLPAIRGYAWTIAWNPHAGDMRQVLCYTFYMTKREARADGKPSPESRLVRVELRAIT